MTNWLQGSSRGRFLLSLMLHPADIGFHLYSEFHERDAHLRQQLKQCIQIRGVHPALQPAHIGPVNPRLKGQKLLSIAAFFPQSPYGHGAGTPDDRRIRSRFHGFVASVISSTAIKGHVFIAVVENAVGGNPLIFNSDSFRRRQTIGGSKLAEMRMNTKKSDVCEISSSFSHFLLIGYWCYWNYARKRCIIAVSFTHRD